MLFTEVMGMNLGEGRLPRFPAEVPAWPAAPGGSVAPGGAGEPGGGESGTAAAARFFEEQVGPLSADQARRLALLTMRYGEAAVVRALAEVVILQMNNAVLALTRDRLLARHPLY